VGVSSIGDTPTHGRPPAAPATFALPCLANPPPALNPKPPLLALSPPPWSTPCNTNHEVHAQDRPLGNAHERD